MKKFLFGCVVMLMTLMTGLSAEDNPRAVIIFDASGSMWGQINGVTKIEIARDALKNVVREWNPSVELGLTVYGHRSKGDCNDIETVIPVGKIDKNRVVKTVMGIKPKGKTPISRSLKKVAEEIKYTEEKATIILISDGKETCDPDPCGTAKELEAQGIDFVTHVIGFNVDKKTSQQLECIANATGGEYFSAKNAAALNSAMKVIAKKVEVVIPPKPVVKKLKNNLEVTASETEGGKWVKAYHMIHAMEDGEIQRSKKNCWSKKKEACLRQLPVGKYVLKSKYNKFKKETAFEIKADEETKLNVVFDQTGNVEITGSETEGGKFISLYGYIYPADENGKKDGGNVGQVNNRNAKEPSIHKIPVGKYMMKVDYNNFSKKVVFEVKAAETNKVHILMGETGNVEISASEKEGGKWVKLYGYIYPADENGKKDGGNVGQVNNRNSKDLTKHKLPVGKYMMKVEYNNIKKEVVFEVKAGETNKVHVVMGETGKVEVSASEKEGGKWISAYHNIVQNEDGKAGDRVARANSSKKSAGKAQIPVGNYIIVSKYNNFKKETHFEIKAGETTKVHVTFGQFFIEAKCSNKDDKINYEIYASSGQMVDEKRIKCSDTLKITLDNGDYSVEAKVGSDTKEVKFTVGGSSSRLLIDMTDIKREPTKDELIKADSQNTPIVEEVKKEQKSEKITIGGKQIEIKGISQKDADKIKELGAILGAFGGMMQGSSPEEQKKKDKQQSAENTKADKEFDDMSKELDMFSK